VKTQTHLLTHLLSLLVSLLVCGLLVGCTAEEKVIEPTDFAFDGTCVNCHNGLSAGHVHKNYKLRCIDCHGGNDQVAVPTDAFKDVARFRDPNLIKQAHVLPDPNIARHFYANGVDDDGDGNCFNDRTIRCESDADCGAGGKCQLVDEPPVFNANRTQLLDPGEIFEPGLHGEGPGEFMDMELNRDLNYTRFLNPGDLRVATISCGGGSRGAFDGGGNGACHQTTIDIVRRSIMVNQAAVTNGAYYGNQSWRAEFIERRDNPMPAADPRFGAFGYGLDYAEGGSVDACIRAPANPNDPRSQPTFDRECLQARAAVVDSVPEVFGGNAIVAGTIGNIGVDVGNGHRPENPATMEIGQGRIDPAPGAGAVTIDQGIGAGDSRYPWGGQPATGDAHADLEPLLNGFLLPEIANISEANPDTGIGGGIPDPVDNILRTFRAYYPLNYPASTTNFNFTFGTSILPEVARFRTGTAYGRGHSSGCSACHTPYNYEGNREPIAIRNDDPTIDRDGDGQPDGPVSFVNDPTTKHREFDPAKDFGQINGIDRLIGRPVRSDEVRDAGPVAKGAIDLDGDGRPDPEQQKTYSANHTTTTRIDTDTCGLCHGFVTRINYAYQGMAEEEQRDALARRAPIAFTTPGGTNVRILDSWIREDNDFNNDGVRDAVPTVVVPDGVDIVNRAKQRDAELAAQGFLPGFGGCVLNTFTEDCNNNGELDTELVLEKRDVNGNLLGSITINEDLNGNGTLDLIDRLPREKAIDGRQVRYVYGGRNGSTRQMDVHFERGMHCIDCHFIQDVHGDGNVYSTNWDAIEIECEDCHGASQRTNFLTSGPNGGNDLRRPRSEDLEPFFEERDGAIIQRSRVTPGLAWRVPQTAEINATNAYAREAHNQQHVAEPREGSTFAGLQGQSELTSAKVECATCHNGFVTNCLGCHVEINIGDKQRDFVRPDGSIVKSAGENEIWLTNKHNPGHINFQLLGLLRGAVYMGVGSHTEHGRLTAMRSSMEVMAGASDQNGHTIRENLSFTTFQMIDGNTGRRNVANSGVAKNQTMAHTVRPGEARGCEMCHSLVANNGQVRNEHLMAQTFSLGTGSLPFTGDWIMATGLNGLELYEYKQERELGNNLNAGASTRFPGLIFNGNGRTAANVEPQLGGLQANDVVLIRNFNPEPPLGGTLPPTLRDFAVIGVDQAGLGRLVISDISARGHPLLAQRPLINDANNVAVVNLAQPPLALAHLGSDVSDPFVYAAVGNAGLQAVKIDNARALTGPINTTTGTPVSVGGQTATDVVLGGDFVFVGTAQGAIQVFDARQNPLQPVPVGQPFQVGARINDMVLNGFVLYAATPNGLTAIAIDFDAAGRVPTLAPPSGASSVQFVGPPALGVAVSEGHAYVATAGAGVHEIDARRPAAMVDLGDIAPGRNVNAVDVILSLLPGQRWVIALEATGDVVYIKLDDTRTRYERCSQNQKSPECELELERFDPTRSGKDPSFDPVRGVFDDPNIDPSAVQFFRQTRTILAGGARRLARPVFYEVIGTLSGRRYRDSFMPGSGVLSTQVMKRMRDVQVCELPGVPSTNPSGLDALGYFAGGDCIPFDSDQKRQRACETGVLAPNVQKIVCAPPRSITAQPLRGAPPMRLPWLRGTTSASR
jgi:hypothetical protein